MASETHRWRPPRFADPDLDMAIRVLYDNVYGLESAAVRGAANAYKLARGNKSVTGTETEIATSLDTVVEVTAVIDSGSSALNEWVSARPSPNLPGAIDLYVWKPTSSSDNTPIASTTARTVRWIATGT